MSTRLAGLPRPFWMLIAGQSLSRFGTATGGVGLVLLMLTSANPVLGIGTVQLALMVPWVILGPVAGVLADRWPKRTTIIGCDLVRAALAAALMLWHDSLPILVALVLAMTCLDVLFAPTLRSLLPELVPHASLPRAVSSYEFASRGAEILGTMTAGLVTTELGFTGVCAINIASYVISAAFMALIPGTTPGTGQKADNTEGLLASMQLGARYIAGHQEIRFVVLFFAAASIFFAAIPVVMPVAVTTIHHLNSTQYSSILSIQSIGGLLGAALIGRLGKSHRPLQLLTTGVGLWGLLVVAVILVPIRGIIVAGIVYLGLGLVANAVNVLYELFIQATAAPEFLGRVFSLDMALSSATSLIAIIAVSTLAPSTHAALAAAALAMTTIITAAIGLLLMSRVK